MSNCLFQEKWFKGDYTVDLAAYYLRNWENYKMQVHQHRQAEVMYVIKGVANSKTAYRVRIS